MVLGPPTPTLILGGPLALVLDLLALKLLAELMVVGFFTG